jgi:hypothetical protein
VLGVFHEILEVSDMESIDNGLHQSVLSFIDQMTEVGITADSQNLLNRVTKLW